MDSTLPPPILHGRDPSPSPLRPGLASPYFKQSSPNLTEQRLSYFGPSPSTPSTPSGILLNRRMDSGSSADPSSPATPSFFTAADAAAPVDPAVSSTAVGLGIESTLARVGSPDGSASEASAGGLSDWSASAGPGGNASTAPSSAIASPDVKPVTSIDRSISPIRSQSPADSLATLSLLTVADPVVLSEAPALRGSRSPSPHCHFAPLPEVEKQERPGTRRNSTVEKNSVPPMSRSRISSLDTSEEPFVMEMDDAPHRQASTLASSLLNMNPNPQVTFRAGRRTSSTGGLRSTSPSPTRRPGSAQSSSRSHSPPPLSRHASQDAMHLHFIASRERSRDRDRPDDGPSSGRVSPFDAPGRDAASLERGISGRCRPAVTSRSSRVLIDGGVEREVVEVAPSEAEDNQDDLEEVEEADEEDEDEDNDSDREEDDGERFANGEDDGSDDDEIDPEAEEEEESEAARSKTARGAGVEVVHWHREPKEGPEPASLASTLGTSSATTPATATAA